MQKVEKKNYKIDQPLLAPFFQSRKNAHKTVTTMLQLFFRKVEKKESQWEKLGEIFDLYSLHVCQYLLSLLLMMSFGTRSWYVYGVVHQAKMSMFITIERKVTHTHTPMNMHTQIETDANLSFLWPMLNRLSKSVRMFVAFLEKTDKNVNSCWKYQAIWNKY